MKYLKSIVENKSWDSISLEEYNNNLWGDEDDDSYDYSLEYVKTTREIFTTKEISILNKIIGTKGVSLNTTELIKANKVGSELKYQNNITGTDYFGNYTRTIIVYKLKAEWYYVFRLDYYNFRGPRSNRSLMYKCDQFDGLIDCLNSFL